MTKEDMKRVMTGKMDPREAAAIGSIYSTNSVRLGWFLQLLPDSTDTLKIFNLHNTKHNHVPTQPSMGMKFRIESNENDIPIRAEFTLQHGLFTTAFFDEPKQILVVRAIGDAGRPLTGREIETATSIPYDGVRKLLSRDQNEKNPMFEKVGKDGKSVLYGLTTYGSVTEMVIKGRSDG
jgi:hypothetical protein